MDKKGCKGCGAVLAPLYETGYCVECDQGQRWSKDVIWLLAIFFVFGTPLMWACQSSQ